MNVVFHSATEADRFLRKRLYVNRTTDPTNLKYLYNAMIKKMQGYPAYNLFTDELDIIAHGKGKTTQIIDLEFMLPDNSDPSFKEKQEQITVGELLIYEDGLEDFDDPEYHQEI